MKVGRTLSIFHAELTRDVAGIVTCDRAVEGDTFRLFRTQERNALTERRFGLYPSLRLGALATCLRALTSSRSTFTLHLPCVCLELPCVCF